MPAKPLEFAVPIVGQPALRGVVPTVLAVCQCSASEPLLFIGIGAVAGCQFCKSAWALEEASCSRAGTSVKLVPIQAKPTIRLQETGDN